MTTRARLTLASAFATLPLLLWLLGLRSATASVAHGLLLLPAIPAAILGLVWGIRERQRLTVAASFGILFPALALSAVRSLREARPAEASQATRSVSLVSYNLLFSSRLDRSLGLLAGSDADLLCLQEVTPTSAARLRRALAARHPFNAVEARHGAYGVAIFSRLPLSHPTLVQDGRRLAGQCVAVALPDGEAVLCNVHLSSPAGIVGRGRRWIAGFDANARVRAAQWRRLRDHVARRYPSARHLVVAGDFNTLDTEPLYRTIRASLVDAFQVAGRGYGATFPAAPTSPTPLFRIDYVFATPSLAPVSAEVLPQGGSDHRALRVRLATPGGRLQP